MRVRRIGSLALIAALMGLVASSTKPAAATYYGGRGGLLAYATWDVSHPLQIRTKTNTAVGSSTGARVPFEATKSFNEPTLAAQDPGYAFAHWGGDYWVFLVPSGGSTTVYQVNGMTGAISSTTAAPGRTIVGAGVSTCAPVVVL